MEPPYLWLCVELCCCPKLASAAFSGLGWAGRTCFWGGWGHTRLGSSQQIRALLTHPTPHAQGERGGSSALSLSTDTPEKKAQQIMALNPAPTWLSNDSPCPLLTLTPPFLGSLTDTPATDVVTNLPGSGCSHQFPLGVSFF